MLAVSFGGGWVLELRDESGLVEVLIAAGGGLDLFATWSDELLASIGVRRQGQWQFASVTFGWTASTTSAAA